MTTDTAFAASRSPFDWRRLWNWKSALVSALGRAPIFFVANLPAGRSAAMAAFLTELVYRVVAAGFYGALTAFFARCQSKRQATALALVVLPLVAHSVEYVVHLLAGTPHIAPAVLGSIAVSMCTTRFSLFVMRRGLFLPGDRSFVADLRALVRLMVAPVITAWRRAGTDGASDLRQP